VRRLAAILRLAGGLDRTHSGQVRDVIVERSGDHGLSMIVIASENPEVDLWSARRRAKMFEKVFDTSLAIHWRPNREASAASDASSTGA
jgi:exopolyphosphatase/guanosine-5'-triphosphate,3'-diphosphate pyrophosphatase